MPLYFFDVFDGQRLWPDKFGEELADLYEAEEQANALLPDLARGKRPTGDELKVIVRCSGGWCCYEASIVFSQRWTGPPAYPPKAFTS